MGFDLIQGVLDLLFLVASAISIVYLRVVRSRVRQLAIEKSRRPPVKDFMDGIGQPDLLVDKPKADSLGEVMSLRVNGEVSQMKSVLAKMTMERSKLQVAFYDAERMIEDLETLQSRWPVESPEPTNKLPPNAVPSSAQVSAVSQKNSPLTDQEKAVFWSRSGQSIGQIAEKLGRSEGEVELILGMARLSGGGVE